jgi:hypothetical protein
VIRQTMTDPDYRALCAELLVALKSWSPHGGGPLECWEDREEEAALIARAEVLLDQPEPAPTDEEIMELMPQQMRDDLAATARAVACGLAITGFERDSSMKSAGAWRIIFNRHAVDHARAVLAKWGHTRQHY